MSQSGGEGGSGYGVKLGLFLDTTNFEAAVNKATTALNRLEKRTGATVRINAKPDYAVFNKALGELVNHYRNKHEVKVGSSFYAAGTAYAISATKFKRDVLSKVQATINTNDDYVLRVRTKFEIDAVVLQRLKNDINAAAKQAAANVNVQAQQKPVNRSSLTGISGRTIDPAAVRSNFARQVANTPKQGGMDAGQVAHLTKALKALGVQLNSTNTAGLRKELQGLFRDASRLGDEVLQGLVDGAKSGKFRDVGLVGAKNFLDGAKDALGIASPSKEFKKIGFWSAVGIGIGFAQEMAKQERAMARSLRQTISRVFRLAGLREEIRQLTASMGDAKSTDNPQRLIQAIERYRRIAASLGETPRLSAAPTQRMGKPSVDVREKGKFVSQRSALTTINNELNRSIKQYLPSYGQIIAQLVPIERDLARLTRRGITRGIEALAPVAEDLGRAVARGVVRGLEEAVPVINQMAADARKALHEATRAKGGPITTDRASLALGAYQARRSGALVDQSIRTVSVGPVQPQRLGGSNPAGYLRDASRIVRSPGGGVMDQSIRPVSIKEIVPPPRNRNLSGTSVIGSLPSWNDPTARDAKGNPFSYNAVNDKYSGDAALKRFMGRLAEVTGWLGMFNDALRKTAIAAQQASMQRYANGGQFTQQIPRHMRMLPYSNPTDPWTHEFNGALRSITSIGRPTPPTGRLPGTRIAGLLSPAINPYEIQDDFPGAGAFYSGPRSASNYRGGSQTFRIRPATFSGSRFASVDDYNDKTLEKGGFTFSEDGDLGYNTYRGRFRNRRYDPNRPGALALRNEEVNPFKSFDELDDRLTAIAGRFAALNQTYAELNTVAKLEVERRKAALSSRLDTVLDFADREESMRAVYGYRRNMLNMENQSPQTQAIAQAFQNLGGESLTAHRLLRQQRNLDVGYINQSTAPGSREQRMAGNLRDIQEAQYVNDIVRQGQSNSGFGGFRGREIGNDTLNKTLQLTDLKNQMIKLEEVAATYDQTGRNTKTYQRVTAALSEEYKRMDVAARVLASSLGDVNVKVSDGEKVTHIARNAWGTILDDFENLVPQLLVFAVAYNLLLQRVMGTPAAVIQAAGAFDRLDTSISSYLSATRGVGDASAELAKVRQIALDTGIGYENAADSYLKFAASTQGTPLQGQEADITRTLANAGRNQGLSGEQVNRSIVALTQILSKGRVQAEELRGQLAEQLPGAIQVAARAYGVSTKELYRMVEAGQLAGDEFVGKFMAQLKAEGANVNQLAGSFSNVTEQFGSTMQMFSASAGQPYLEPLTSGLQALNALMTTLIPAAGLLGSVFLATGSKIAKGALGISSWRQAASDIVKEQFNKQNTSTILLDKDGNPLSTKAPSTDRGRLTTGLQQAAEGAKQLGANLNPAQKSSVTIAQSAEKIGSGLKTAGVAAWNMSGGLRETLVSALKFYVVMEGISTILKFAKGELGSLGDEIKKLDGMDKFGSDQKNNRRQIELNPFALIARSVTIGDAGKIAGDARETTRNINDNAKPIEASLRQLNAVERQLFDARMQRDRLSRGGTQQEIEDNRKLIEQLEQRRKLIQDLLPNVQGRLTVIDSALQAMKEVEQNDPSARGKIAASARIKELERERAALVAAATRRGLIGRQLPQYKTLAAIEGDRTAAVASMQNNPLDSTLYRDAQKIAVGAQKLGADSQLLPQEQELQTLDLLMKSLTAEQQKQETIARIRLGTIENERKAIEAALSLEQTRNRLRQVIANGKVQIASELGVPEQRLAAERAERLENQAGQRRELAIQSQLIAKDKERIGIETSLQKQQIELDKVQLEITIKQLEVEKLKIVLAMQNKNVTKEQEAIYKKQIQYLDQAIGSTKEGLKNQGNMNALLDQTAAAQRDALEIKEQELAVQLQIVDATGANAAKLEEIKAAKQDIENRERAALDKVAELNKAIEEQNALYQDRAETIRATIEAEKQRAQDTQDSLRTEADLITRMLDAYTSRREGGFFERQNKAQLLEGTGEQQAYQLAERRYQLLQKIQQEQNRMKLLDLTLKEKELEIEEEMYKLKILGLKAANEEARIRLRNQAETLVMQVDKLGAAATPDQVASAGIARRILTEGFGYNPSPGGNSLTISGRSIEANYNSYLASEANTNSIAAGASGLFAERRALLSDQRSAQMGVMDTQTRLAEYDARAGFARFLDEATATGRVLSEVANGFGEFRQSVANAFTEGLFNGDAKEGLLNAGEALGKKITTSLVDEFILKPIEDNLFKGLTALFGFDKPQDPVVANTQQTVNEVQKVSQGLGTVNSAITSGADRIVAAINGLSKPTSTPPTYPTPEQISAIATPGAAYPAGGSIATFGETGRVFNKMPGWIHGHLQPVAGKGTMEDLVNDGVAMAKALIAQGVESYFGNDPAREVKMKAGMSDEQIRAGVRSAISQHKGQGAIDIWVKKGTKVPMPLYDVRSSSGNEGINGLMPSGKTFMGHLAEESLARRPYPQAVAPVPSRPTSGGTAAAALSKYDANTQALLKTIMYAEGTLSPGGTDLDKAFRTNFGGSQFSSFAKHPGTYVAGAYQMKPGTFGESAAALGLRDFSPESQTAAILHQIRQRGVDPSQPLTKQGINDLSRLFATFPTSAGRSYYGQGFKPASDLLSRYNGYLGTSTGGQLVQPSAASTIDTRPVVEAIEPAAESMQQSAALITPAFSDTASAATSLAEKLRGLTNGASLSGGTGESTGVTQIPVVPFQGQQATDGAMPDMESLSEAAAGATTSLRQVERSSIQTPQALTGLNSALGAVMQGLGGIGMGLAGVSQMGQGGTQNTLLGLAGIFGGISSIAGMFTPGGGLASLFGGGGGSGSAVGGLFGAASSLFRASGGPVTANSPYIVGEKGPELIFPKVSGRVMNATDTERHINNLRRLLVASSAAKNPGYNQSNELDYPVLPGFQPRQLSANESKELSIEASQRARSAYQEGDVEQYMKYASFARQFGPTLYGKDGRVIRGGADTVFEQTRDSDRADSSASTLTVRYESQVINNVEYVTVDQMRMATKEAAERGRSMALNSLQNSVRTRKRVGI